MSSSSLVEVIRPGSRFVVAGAGLEASVQDADEPVGELAQRGVVADAAGALLVVVGAGAGRGFQRGESLGHQRVDEPVVVHEPGRDGSLLPGRPGDRAGRGVVLAGLRGDVPVMVVAELAEYPSAEDHTESGLGPDDLSVRVPTKMGLHLP